MSNKPIVKMPEHITDIMMHVGFISTFIVIFFFTYGSYTEKKIVEEQLDFLIEDNNNIFKVLPASSKKEITDAIDKNIEKVKINFKEKDETVLKKNNKLKKKAFIIISVFLTIIIVVSYMISKKYGFSYREKIKDNMISLVFIALVYFMYITFYAKKYLFVDPNIIKKFIYTRLFNKNPQENYINEDINEDIKDTRATDAIANKLLNINNKWF